MDESEKEYFGRLTSLASAYQANKCELAKSRVMMFASSLTRQIEKDKTYDLIVAAGNSGLFMMKLAKMTYDALGKNLPDYIVLPIIRFSDESETTLYDNSSLLPYIPTELPKHLNMLFVDDEIMRGITLKHSIDLIILQNPKIMHIDCTVIAENHFFEWHYDMPQVSIQFFAYARLIHGLNGNIGHFVPEDMFENIKKKIPGVTSYNHAMAIVTGNGFKRTNDQGIPYFDTDVTSICSKHIPEYHQKEKLLVNELNDLVEKGIEGYKNGTITFRF